MARDQAYYEAEKKIEQARRSANQIEVKYQSQKEHPND